MKSISLPLLILAAGAGHLAAQNETYSIYGVFNDQPGTVYLNGFPLLEDDGSSDGSTATTSFLNQLLIQGNNTIRIELTDRVDADNNDAPIPGIFLMRLERGPKADAQRIEFLTLERETRARESLHEEVMRITSESGLQAEARGLLDGRRSSLTLDGATPSYAYQQLEDPGPSTIEFTFQATDVPLTTLPWLSPAVALTPADEVAIAAQVEALHTSLKDKDTDAVLLAIANKTARLAVGLDQTVAQMEANLAAIWDLLFDDAAFTFGDVDPSGLQFESFPDVNLVRVTAADGGPPIRGSGGGKEFVLPLFFSKLGGTWTIVD